MIRRDERTHHQPEQVVAVPVEDVAQPQHLVLSFPAKMAGPTQSHSRWSSVIRVPIGTG